MRPVRDYGLRWHCLVGCPGGPLLLIGVFYVTSGPCAFQVEMSIVEVPDIPVSAILAIDVVGIYTVVDVVVSSYCGGEMFSFLRHKFGLLVPFG